MSFLSSLLAGANVPFTIVLGITVVFALLQMTGVLGLLAGGADHDADTDADTDTDTDTDAIADADHDADHASSGSVLAGFGVGRVPFSILWQTFALSFALAGITADTLVLSSRHALPTATLAWTLPLALCIGLACTRAVARVLGPLLSNPQQDATSRAELVGLAGVVISSRVHDAFGEVRIHDKTGHVLRVICRVHEGDAPIPEGSEIVVVEYDAARDQLFVAPLDAVRVDPSDRASGVNTLQPRESGTVPRRHTRR